jgi:hypothetical protein
MLGPKEEEKAKRDARFLSRQKREKDTILHP